MKSVSLLIRTGPMGLDSQQEKDFDVLRSIQNGSGAHPASCPVGNGGSFIGVKATGA
jgi:hypothetical protein